LVTTKGNLVSFKPETPPLIPIAGAPKPSYSIYGIRDGHYSKEAEPKHTYKKKGTYTSRLTVTNNYDNGKPQQPGLKKVVNEIDTDSYKKYCIYRRTKWVYNSKNRDPIPEQEIVVIVSYQNMENYVSNGKLYLLMKTIQNNNFELVDFRTHAGEREIKENLLHL
jgi:hypothetical protein